MTGGDVGELATSTPGSSRGRHPKAFARATMDPPLIRLLGRVCPCRVLHRLGGRRSILTRWELSALAPIRVGPTDQLTPLRLIEISSNDLTDLVNPCHR